MLPHSRRPRHHDGKDWNIEALRETECAWQKCGLYTEQGSLRKDHHMVSRRNRHACFADHLPKRAGTLLRIDCDVTATLHGSPDSRPAEDFTSGNKPQREGQCTEAQGIRHAFVQRKHETGNSRQALQPLDTEIDREVTQQAISGSLLRC